MKQSPDVLSSKTRIHPAETSYPLGVSRPPLDVADLPTPEVVFKARKVGIEELFLLVLGPSMIGLGWAIGSGEWLLGPLNVTKYGFRGIGWVILISAVLQVFYNVELGRYTMATGETATVGFGRVPPGYLFWVPLALGALYITYILGGWTLGAGGILFALFNGRPYAADEIEIVRILGIGLLITVFLFVSFGRRIERTLEVAQGTLIIFILTGLIFVTLAVVPFEFWGKAVISLVTPAAPPAGTDPSLLGGLAGFTAAAAGLNFVFTHYYRDKGYGMGFKMGFIPSWLGGKKTAIKPVGVTFPESEKNTALWKRWFRYLLIDQWGIFFTGALIGIMAPSILAAYLASLPGAEQPTQISMPVYIAFQLGNRYGPILYGWALMTGFMILYTTQVMIVEFLTRTVSDSLYSLSGRFRRWIDDDIRRFYYPFMAFLIVVIGVIIHLAAPEFLTLLSANLANFASLLLPLGLMYLNSRLPRPARIRWWSYLVLILNVLFFGFFFLNFISVQIIGVPLVKF